MDMLEDGEVIAHDDQVQQLLVSLARTASPALRSDSGCETAAARSGLAVAIESANASV